MPSIALDSGPAIALFNKRDKHHERAVGFLRGTPRATFVTTSAVVTEVAYVLGPRAPIFIDWVKGAVTLDQGLFDDLTLISSILRKYKSLRPDFADASVIAMCERRGIDRIATFDSDFTVYRLQHGNALEIVI